MRPKLTTERTAGTEKLEKPLCALCALCALWYDPPSSRAGWIVTTERTAGTENGRNLCVLWVLCGMILPCWVYCYHREHRGHRELEQPLCALGALWYDPPSSRAGCIVTTECTEGTENGRNLCVLWVLCGMILHPPVLGVLLPQGAQRARRIGATSVCSVCSVV